MELFMKDLLTYLSTAPVIAAIWMGITAGILIEFNRFYPDLLFHPL
jgi:photosystem I subunit IX